MPLKWISPRATMEQATETARRARSADALAGCRLGHMVPRHEKREHGWVPQLGPQLAPIDGVDVAEQVGVALVILPHQDAELREQRVIVQCFERVMGAHDPWITCVFEALCSPSPFGAARRRVVRRGWRVVHFSRGNRLGWRSGAPEALSERARR